MKSDNIILYHQHSCPQCKMVEMQLKNKKINYDSCMDIDTMKSKGLTRTPVLEVNGEMLVGKDILNWINSRGN